jgi:hypothetical protein
MPAAMDEALAAAREALSGVRVSPTPHPKPRPRD